MKKTCVAFALLIAALAFGCSGATVTGDRAWGHEASAVELLRRGDASARLGDMTRAEQYFVLARRAGADAHDVTSRLLAVCVADQRYPVALEYAEEHLRLHPTDSQVKFAAASLQAALGNLPQARELMLEVLGEQPAWAEAHYALASLLRQSGEESMLANEHDLTYLKLRPAGEYAEAARERLRRSLR